MVSVARMSGVCGIRKGVYLLYLVGSMTQVIFLCVRALPCGQVTLGVVWEVVCVSL